MDGIDNYETTYNSYDIHNVYSAKVTVSGTKTWIDYQNADKTRPESITLNLLQNGEPLLDSNGNAITKIVTEDENGNWTYEFSGLDKYDKYNELYTYTVTEDSIENYVKEIHGYDIINTYETTTSVSGAKIWVDYNNKYQTRPDSITIHLLKDGVEIESKKVTAKNDWNYAFTNLERYKANGEEYVYTITEDTVEGYSTYTDDNYNTINKLVDGYYTIQIKKLGENEELLSSAVFKVNNKYKYKTDEIGIAEVAKYKYISYKNSTRKDVYKIVEIEAPSGYKTYDGEIEVTVEKKLADNGKWYVLSDVSLNKEASNSGNVSISIEENVITVTVKDEKIKEETKNDDTQAKGKLPQTGERAIIFASIGVLTITAIGLFFAIKKYNLK